MAMTPTGIARTVGLWVLIICSALSVTILILTGNPLWFEIFIVIAIWICWREIYGLTIGFPNEQGKLEKMTISTAYKKYIQRVGWIGYVPITLFWVAMTGFFVHLIFW